MSLSGEEIDDYLEYSFGNWFNEMTDSSDHLLRFKMNDNGEIEYSTRTGHPQLEAIYYNYSSAAGINYTVDVSKPAGNRVKIATLSDGTGFDVDKIYTVSINSYRGSGGGGLLTRGANIPQDELSERIISSTDHDMKFVLMEWIKDKEIIRPDNIGNWKIIPKKWWEEGKERDYEILFDKKPDSVKKETEEKTQ
jgi:2',3'-cyclic-nucleotide 2'-phosphodiesterase/3'-nucleotidase